MDGVQLSSNHGRLRCAIVRQGPASRRPFRPGIAHILLLPALLAVMLTGAPSRAQKPGAGEDSVGPALICNTPQQLKRFVDLLNGGREAAQAIRLVNEEAQNPIACGNALVAFEVGKPVAEAKLHGESVSIIEVKVFALNDGTEWTQVEPTAQYTIRRHPGETL